MLTVRTHSKFRKFQKGLRGLMAVLVMLTASGPLPQASAQGLDPVLAGLPPVGTLMGLTPSFTPLSIRGLTVHPENPLEFDFIIDTGDEALLDQEIRDQSTRLVKYFLAAMTVPEDELWVNLSPYEANRVISPVLGATELGRDLLAQDYLLKQLAASLMSPNEDLGATFWENVQERLRNQIPGFDHTLDATTFNKIWIVPGSAVVYEHENHAFVLESRLKVMMESDYLAHKQREGISTFDQELVTDGTVQEETSEVMRQWLLPAIEKEVNEGAVFANLRQIYAAMILATWYKQNLRQSLLGQVYADQSRIRGVDVADPTVSEKIYQRYLQSFRQGVYDYIKDEYDPLTQSVVSRKYFSGGKDFSMLSDILERVTKRTSTLFGYGTQGVKSQGRSFSLFFRLKEVDSGWTSVSLPRMWNYPLFLKIRNWMLSGSLSMALVFVSASSQADSWALEQGKRSSAPPTSIQEGDDPKASPGNLFKWMGNKIQQVINPSEKSEPPTSSSVQSSVSGDQTLSNQMRNQVEDYKRGRLPESAMVDYLNTVTPAHFSVDSTLAVLDLVVWNENELLSALQKDRRVSAAVFMAFQKAPKETLLWLRQMMNQDQYSVRQRAAATVMSAWLLDPNVISDLGNLLRGVEQPYWLRVAAARGLTMFIEAEKRGVVELGGLVSIRSSEALRGLLDNAKSMGIMSPQDAQNIELAIRSDEKKNVDRVTNEIGEGQFVVNLNDGEIRSGFDPENIVRISESGAGIFVQLARLLKSTGESAVMREITKATEGLTEFRSVDLPSQGELARVADIRRLAVDMNIAALPDPQAVKNLMSLLKAADDDVRSWTYLRLGQYLEAQSDNMELVMRIDPVANELRQQFPNDFERIMEQAKAFWWQTIFEFVSTRAMGTDQNQTTGYIYDGQKAIRAFLDNGTFEQQAVALGDAVGSRGLRLGLGRLLDSVSRTPEVGLVIGLLQMMGLELMLDKQRNEILESQITLAMGDRRLLGAHLFAIDLVKIFGDQGNSSNRDLMNRIANNPAVPAALRYAALDALAQWNALDVGALKRSIPASGANLTLSAKWKAIVAVDSLAVSMARGHRNAFETLQEIVERKDNFLSPIAMQGLVFAVESGTNHSTQQSVFMKEVLNVFQNLFAKDGELGWRAMRAASELGSWASGDLRIRLIRQFEQVRDDDSRSFESRVTAVEELRNLGQDSELSEITIPPSEIAEYQNGKSAGRMMEDLSSQNLQRALLSRAALLKRGASAIKDLIDGSRPDSRNPSDRRVVMVDLAGEIAESLSGDAMGPLIEHLKSLFENDRDFQVRQEAARRLVGLGEQQYILEKISGLFESEWKVPAGDADLVNNVLANGVGEFWDFRTAKPQKRRFDEVFQSAANGDQDSLALLKWLAIESEGNTLENRRQAIHVLVQLLTPEEFKTILAENPDLTLMPMIIDEFRAMAKRLRNGSAEGYAERMTPIYNVLQRIINDRDDVESQMLAVDAITEIFPELQGEADPYYQIIKDYGENGLMMFRRLIDFFVSLADSDNQPAALRGKVLDLLSERLKVPWVTNDPRTFGDHQLDSSERGDALSAVGQKQAQDRALVEAIFSEMIRAWRSGVTVAVLDDFLGNNDVHPRLRSVVASLMRAFNGRNSGIDASDPQGLLNSLDEPNYDILLDKVQTLLIIPGVTPQRVGDALLDVMHNGTWGERENAVLVFEEVMMDLEDFQSRPDVLARILAAFIGGEPNIAFAITQAVAAMNIDPLRLVAALRLGQFDGDVRPSELNGIHRDVDELFNGLVEALLINEDGHALLLPPLAENPLPAEFKDYWPDIYAVLSRNVFSLLPQIDHLMQFPGENVTALQSREGEVIVLEYQILQVLTPWEIPRALASDATFLKDYWKVVLGILDQLYQKEVSTVSNPPSSMLNLSEGSVPNLEDVRRQLEEWLDDADRNKVGQAAHMFQYLFDNGILDPGAPSMRPLAQAAQKARMSLGDAGDWSSTYRLILDVMGEARVNPEALSNDEIRQLLSEGVSKETLDRLGLGGGNLYVENNRYMLLLSTAELWVIIAEDRTRGLAPDKISGLLDEARELLDQAQTQMNIDLRAISLREAQIKRNQFQPVLYDLNARIAAVAGEVGREAQRDESARATESLQSLVGDFVTRMQGDAPEAISLKTLASQQLVTEEQRVELGNYLKSTAEKMIASQEGDVALENSIWHQLQAAGESLTSGKDISSAVETVKWIRERAQAIVDSDLAMVSPTPEETVQKESAEVGGIDLNPALMNLHIRRDARGVPLPVSAQPLETIRIEGFVPVLIHMTPVLSLPLLLGLGDESPSLEIGYLP